MVENFLPTITTISSLVALGELGATATDWDVLNPDDLADGESHRSYQAERAQAEWQGAVASLGYLLQHTLPHQHHTNNGHSRKSGAKRSRTAAPQTAGLLLSGPFPVVESPELTIQLSNWVFIPPPLDQLSQAFSQLMPADKKSPTSTTAARVLPLIEGDPLAGEQFCLLLTQRFSIVLVLGRDADDELRFQFSFTPTVIKQVWQLLRSRIYLTNPKQLDFIDPLVEIFAPTAPDYRIVSQFSRWMLSSLPAPKPNRSPMVERITSPTSPVNNNSDVHGLDTELLQAMAHEIRTPLTTIRTLTRSLIRRKDLVEKAKQRLQQIDNACTQ